MPDSITVGVSGKSDERALPVTASALSLPDLTNGSAGAVPAKYSSTSFATTAAAADRLVIGVLELLRTVDPTIDPQDGVADLVQSGDLDRLLEASRSARG